MNRSFQSDCTSSLTDLSRTLAIHRSVSCIVRSASDTALRVRSPNSYPSFPVYCVTVRVKSDAVFFVRSPNWYVSLLRTNFPTLESASVGRLTLNCQLAPVMASGYVLRQAGTREPSGLACSSAVVGAAAIAADIRRPPRIADEPSETSEQTRHRRAV